MTEHSPRRPRPRNAYAAPAWAAEQRVGDVGTKATLLVLANYADENFSCYPGQDTIAFETEQSVSTVARQIKRLKALGLITTEHRYDERGKRTSDRYYLQLDVSVDVERPKRRSRGVPEQPKPLPVNLTGSAEPLPVNLTGSANAPEENMPGTTRHLVTGSTTRHQVTGSDRDESGTTRHQVTGSTTCQTGGSLPVTAMTDELLDIRTPRTEEPSLSLGASFQERSSSRRTELTDAHARGSQDDDHSMIENAIVQTILAETRVRITAADAARIRHELLDGRTDIERPVVYVTRSIRNDPQRFVPASARPGPPPVAQVLATDGRPASDATRRAAVEQVRAQLARSRRANS
ncbi:helix-turn-helix domain-containing protein [Nonomuraea rubra]|uniref:helix-turn-helix domain-containing protein n=1 Tax=Nonomuraea rubra TaxID=46180 RepID=UPI0033E2E7D7